MNESFTRSHMKLWVALAAVLLAVACCFAVTPKAYASGVDWNNSVTVDATANPYDATASGTDYNQTIDVTMTFAATLPDSITSDVAQSYLQSHTSIAGRMLNGANYSTYVRAIDNVEVDEREITFTVEHNTAGMTAIYSGEFKVTADADANSAFASAMGSNAVETLINTGLDVDTTNSTDMKSATINISALPECRAMNFILISDGNNYIFSNGTSADGKGLTIHSHMFYQQTALNYATSLVGAANNAGATNLGYVFTNNQDGTITVSKADGSAMNGINAVVYNGNYLNFHSLKVGTTTEPIWSGFLF